VLECFESVAIKLLTKPKLCRRCDDGDEQMTEWDTGYNVEVEEVVEKGDTRGYHAEKEDGESKGNTPMESMPPLLYFFGT
jgi:hypothetical protein